MRGIPPDQLLQVHAHFLSVQVVSLAKLQLVGITWNHSLSNIDGDFRVLLAATGFYLGYLTKGFLPSYLG
jgi:hypothetical protein